MNLQRIRKILKKAAVWKIFFLPPLPTLLIVVPAYGLVIYALTGENVDPVIAYVSYLLSAYALIITVTGIIRIVHRGRQTIGQHPFVRKMLSIPVINRYFREDLFRVETALYPGFLINLFYAGVKMFSGIRYRSIWFVTLAVYYILLAVMRFSLLHYVNPPGIPLWPSGRFTKVRKERSSGKNRASEWRRYRLCGMILLLMNFALSGIVVLAVHQNSGFEYPGILIYIMAMYTFYAVITAVWNVVKFRKYGRPVLSAAKVISLTAAMVSMLSLETAMLTQFGTADDTDFRRIMTASTGAGVCVIVLGMAVYMIVHATKKLKAVTD